MSQTDQLDQHCAPRSGIVRLGEAHNFETHCKPMDPEWRQRVQENWWGRKDREADPRLANGDAMDTRLYDLRDALIKMGGERACMPCMEEDLDKILARGQLWSGRNLKMMRGEWGQCHGNSCFLWENNQDKDLFLATGYALSSDGMWRQHSWAVLNKPRSVRIIETTEPRELYFGFIMTLDETMEFGEHNTDFGLEVHQETRERYQAILPSINRMKP